MAIAQDLSCIKEGSRGLVVTADIRPAEMTPTGESRWVLTFGCSRHPGLEEVGHADDPSLSTEDPVFVRQPLTDDLKATNWFQGWSVNQLFAFDETSVFDGAYKGTQGGNLFSFENGKLKANLGQAQALASKRFGLPSKAIYLGSVRGRRFYWIEGKPRKIYFFEGESAHLNTHVLDLPKEVKKPLGIANGDPKGDWALQATCKAPGWYSAPNAIHWVVLYAKDAKAVQ